MIKRILQLLILDAKLELRNPYYIFGVLIYLVSSVYIVYKTFNNIDNPLTWNALFWVLLLFATVNASLKSFTGSLHSRALYYYSHFDPTEVFIAKIIFQFILFLGLGFVLALLMQVFFPLTIRDVSLLFAIIVMSCTGLSIVFSLIAAVSTQGGQSSILMAILGMPAVIPILLLSIKVSLQATGAINDTSIQDDFILLAGVNVLMAGISFILFPYLWKS